MTLTKIPSTGRDARWYYLSALANHGMGNSPRDVDMMQRAVQLDPNNRTYQSLLRQYRNSGPRYTYTTYNTRNSGRQSRQSSGMSIVGRLFLGYMMIQFFFMLLRILLGGGFFFFF